MFLTASGLVTAGFVVLPLLVAAGFVLLTLAIASGLGVSLTRFGDDGTKPLAGIRV